MASTIRFSKADLQLFSDFSGDRNPLHLSEAYAARTAYGQPVVFGVLGAIACLGQLRLRPNALVKSLDAEFRRPLFCGVDYRAEITERGEKQTVRLFDGSVPVLALTVVPGPDEAPPRGVSAAGGLAERTVARLRAPDEIQVGTRISGNYKTNLDLAPALASRWGTAVGFDLLEAMALSSYIVGMELPGEKALFFRLLLRFGPRGEASDGEALQYRAEVQAVNARLGHVRMSLEIAASGRALASGECHSFYRAALPEQPEATPDPNRSLALEGKQVAVIGASRGLGAAIRLHLTRRGAAVYTLSRTAPDDADPALTETGDAADPEALRRLRNRIEMRASRLDLLVCNACPPIVPLRLEPNAQERIEDYIRRAISLTLTPMCTLLDLLEASGGALIVISSAAVAQPVREWPHYAAAKQAVEALAHTAVLQYPAVRGLIVRPEKLLTEMTGTPIGRLGAASPASVAQRIADRWAANTLRPGAVEILSGQESSC